MKLAKVIWFSIIITVMLFNFSAYANSGPLVREESPGFSMAPAGSTPISIVRENLKFDISGQKESAAKVTASYEMMNTSDAPVKQAMLFPYVTSDSRGFEGSVRITAGGKPVEFKTFRLDDIPFFSSNSGLNFKDNANEELSQAIDMGNIIKMLNNAEYSPKNYSPNEVVKIYTIHMPKREKQYQAEVAFKLDSNKVKLLYCNFHGTTWNSDGSGKLMTWVPSINDSTKREDSYIITLGESSNNTAEIMSLTGQEIIVEENTVAGFLQSDVVKGIYSKYDISGQDELDAYIIKKLDTVLGSGKPFIALDSDVVSTFFNSNYIGAFLYTVDFDARSSMNVTVEYEMQATLDRRKTRDNTNLFLYLLKPALGWKSFSNLDITVILNKNSPYIIESSLMLSKDDAAGVYSGHFDSLPDKDFYFATYKTDKEDPPVSGSAMFLTYFTIIIVSFLLILVMALVIILIVFIVRKRRRNNMTR